MPRNRKALEGIDARCDQAERATAKDEDEDGSISRDAIIFTRRGGYTPE
jgi:hypothetical protein